jgi:hypothetical protein
MKPSDEAIDRLLRASLGGPNAMSAGTDCLDGETVAAWMEGRLSTSDVSAAEAHAAKCGRCQALLAAFARTEPTPPVRESLFERWRLRWLVPITAAAAAVVLYVVVPRRDAVLEMQRAQESVAVSESAAEPPAATGRAPESVSDANAGNQGQSKAKVGEEQRRANAATGQPPADQNADALERSVEKPAGFRDGADARARDDAAPRQEPAAPSTAAARELSQRTAMVGALTASGDIVSPDPMQRWRLGDPGFIQRSTDGGATWEVLSTGASVRMTAGTAPLLTVVWLVGPGGTVLLSTDGRVWRQVTTPAQVDLVSVQAVDARSATVTGADGRVFRTSDGGQSWQ